MEKKKRKSALIFPFLFIIRRLFFTAVVIWLDWFIWAQIAMQFSTSIIMIIYLGYVWPFESHTITKLEIFNELIGFLLCYFMFCFTDWIGKSSTRYLCGWVFISIICLHLSTHLIMLLYNSFQVMRENRRKKKYKKTIKEK